MAALARNRGAGETDLLVFCDGARDESERAAVDAARAVAAAAAGFRSVTVDAAECHLGLAASVISAVTRTLESHEAAIVVEDDLETSPWFLDYMNRALAMYADDDRVVSIHGYTPVPAERSFFLRGADCWGWGVWRRSWKIFDPDAAALVAGFTPQLRRRFDFDGAFPYFKMLKDQAAGRIDSWAVRFHASAFLAGKLTLYPARTLVRNIGMDGSGTHCGIDAGLEAMPSPSPVDPAAEVVESEAMREKFAASFRASAPTLWRRVKGRLARLWE
ncbi:MAG: glycosyltransferase family 2 protein [Victivallaceae bacterium]|nr:hypothetical protein [Victivallaceae bacterium]